MTVQKSTALRNAEANQFESVAGASAKLQLRSGAQPADCATAASGTLIAEMALPSDWLGAASAGAVAKAGTWSVAAALAGTIGHFRFVDNAGTTCHMQGSASYVAAAWAATTAYNLGDKKRNGGRVYTCTTAGTSAGSGGPTGTGTGITDGSCVWNYVSEYGDMQFDNVVVEAGQIVTATTFTATQSGA